MRMDTLSGTTRLLATVVDETDAYANEGGSRSAKDTSGSELFDEGNGDELGAVAAATKVNSLSQRPVAKKVIVLTRRDLSDQNILESQRGGARKQRTARKRNNTIFDYLS
ncbi:hypothetical protein Tcan_02546 [Toxocara canis]|uniref:Uncharacterized protein n=1 Tax=Toxocara canis TaxID=6265 RepID=A0A0B2UP59_TOXCA|nr:hypothetical protein Tcan_02546 [Toxocara canis]